METRANYIVTGAFTLAVIVGVFGFIFWFQNTAGGGEHSSYRVVFVGSVSGLRTGSAVLSGERMAGGKLVHYVEDLVERGSVIRRPDNETTVEAVGDKKIGPNGNWALWKILYSDR